MTGTRQWPTYLPSFSSFLKKISFVSCPFPRSFWSVLIPFSSSLWDGEGSEPGELRKEVFHSIILKTLGRVKLRACKETFPFCFYLVLASLIWKHCSIPALALWRVFLSVGETGRKDLRPQVGGVLLVTRQRCSEDAVSSVPLDVFQGLFPLTQPLT